MQAGRQPPPHPSALRSLPSKADDSEIRHVSDTALWVAAFRAQEGCRSNAAFSDPLAAILSGDRGRAMARAMPRPALVGWGMIVRTSAIDRLIDEALAGGVDTVLNLGAGLDTRPYRMKLPADLSWIEMDFPNIVDLKNSALVARQAVCKLERVGIDLLDLASRRKLLAQYASSAKSALVITEGVLPYFSVHDAATLAGDLHAAAAIRYWIQDFDNAAQRSSSRGWEAKLEAAPLLFKVNDWFQFFAKYGWTCSHVITSLEESQRINRPYPLDLPFGLIMRALPKSMREKILSLSGAVLLQTAGSAS